MATACLYDEGDKGLCQARPSGAEGVRGGLTPFSLDEAGNSVRGQRAIADITTEMRANP